MTAAVVQRSFIVPVPLFPGVGFVFQGIKRTHVATACAGLALGAFAGSFNTPESYPFLLGMALFLCALVITPKSRSILHPGITTMVAVVVSLSLVAAVFPVANRGISQIMGIWAVFMLILYLRPVKFNSLSWLIPFWLVHAGLVIFQGITHTAAEGRAVGITGSPNIAGGFLVIGIVYLSFTKYRWLALPLVVALPFTGTRLAVIVLVTMLLSRGILRLAQHRRSWVFSLVCLAVLVTTIGVFRDETYRSAVIRLGGEFGSSVATTVGGLKDGLRVRLDRPLSSDGTLLDAIKPRGYIGDYGVHSVPLRLFWELGIVGSVAWGTATLLLLTRRIGSPVWWVFLTITLLSSLDYYTWMPLGVSAFWWLCAGVLARDDQSPKQRSILPH